MHCSCSTPLFFTQHTPQLSRPSPQLCFPLPIPLPFRFPPLPKTTTAKTILRSLCPLGLHPTLPLSSPASARSRLGHWVCPLPMAVLSIATVEQATLPGTDRTRVWEFTDPPPSETLFVLPSCPEASGTRLFWVLYKHAGRQLLAWKTHSLSKNKAEHAGDLNRTKCRARVEAHSSNEKFAVCILQASKLWGKKNNNVKRK